MIKRFPTNWIGKATKHYEHAIEKHPHFVDVFATKADLQDVNEALDMLRKELKEQSRKHKRPTECVLFCEVMEIYEAYARGDKAQAVEECYDTIAVLMRMICVLEQEQARAKARGR